MATGVFYGQNSSRRENREKKREQTKMKNAERPFVFLTKLIGLRPTVAGRERQLSFGRRGGLPDSCTPPGRGVRRRRRRRALNPAAFTSVLFGKRQRSTAALSRICL